MTNYIFSFLTEWEIEAKEHYPHDQLPILFCKRGLLLLCLKGLHNEDVFYSNILIKKRLPSS